MAVSKYIITGAAGHLGGTILRRLEAEDCEVRALLLPGETPVAFSSAIRYFEGDICQPETLRPLFEGFCDNNTVVIHAAGLISIANQVSPRLYEVNVTGTKNVLALCRMYPPRRLVHVSSVHAIPERPQGQIIREVEEFSPDGVTGGYAKTKAEATQAVLDARMTGLDVVVVHPSGIIGPYDSGRNHSVQVIRDALRGRLPACVQGGYDFVDVRDVAAGILAAAERGKSGQCYILGNRHVKVSELVNEATRIAGCRKLPVLPMWMAKLAAPFFEWSANRRGERPLYTSYSLYTLMSNSNFSHEKAERDLGYRTRPLKSTIADTVAWLQKSGALVC